MNLKIFMFIGLLLLLQLSLCRATTPKTSSGMCGHCSTWGSGNYQMLNGQTHYVNTNNKIALIYQNVEENPEFVIYCQRHSGSLVNIHAKIDSSDIVINTSGIHVNNHRIKVPYTNGNIHVRNSGMYTQITSQRSMLSMTFKLNHGINIHLLKDYEIGGICGNSKIVSAEEWQQLVRDYIIHEGGEDGEVQFLPNNLSGKGKEYCDNMFKAYFPNMDGLKSACEHDYELCDQEDARVCTCSTFIQAAKIIGNNGCSEKTRFWRKDINVVCDKQDCPESQIFSECIQLPEPTCTNPIPVYEKEVVAGCTSPDGLVLDDIGGSNRYVNIDDCPCLYDKIYQPNEKRKGSCNSECSCSRGNWDCSDEKCPGTCKIAYDAYVSTFDGMEYSLSGNCQYTIFQIPGLTISAAIETPNAQSACSLSSITINIKGGDDEHTFEISKDCTFRDMDVAHYMSDDLYVKQHDQDVYIKLLNKVELFVQCKPTMQACISIPFENADSSYDFLSKGLCGSYNQDSTDDFRSSNNIIEPSPAVFAESWAQSSCSPAEQTTCINLEKELFSEEHCSELKNPSGVFSKGHFYVDYRPYYERCVSSTCKSEDVWAGLCSALENYVHACAEKGVLLHNWRNQNCKKECMNNQVLRFTTVSCFPSCASTSHVCDNQGLVMEMCTCEEDQYLNSENICVPNEDCDCQHLHGVMPAHTEMEIDRKLCKCRAGILECDLSSEDMCSGGAKYTICPYPSTQGKAELTCKTMHLPAMHQNNLCEPGCYCPVGMVRDSRGQCIPPEDCPCLYGGAEYKSGSTIKISCRKCHCNQGQWDCTEENCESVCTIHGRGNIANFDGMWYSFGGLCQYTIVEGKEKDTFRISMQNEPCCEEGLTCSRKVILQIPGVTITLQDGKARTEISQDYSLKNPKNKYSIINVGMHIVVQLKQGIDLIWDGTTDITLKCSPELAGKVRGLCGNNNNYKMDDFTDRRGNKVTRPLDLGKGWKDDPSCQDIEVQISPCDAKPNCKPWALRKCQILKEELFKECHSKVDPTLYYEKCIEEACVCDMEGKYLGYCSSVSMYAHACLKKGVCVNWRNPDLCPVYCDYYNIYGETTWHYEPCGTAQVQTCSNQELFSSYSVLLAGCYPRCSTDTPFLDPNTKTCVRLSDCSCSHNGRIMAANSMIVDEFGRTCYCSKGHVIFQEEEEKPPESRYPEVPPSAPNCNIQGSLKPGSNVTLSCNSKDGFPNTTYHWEKMGSPILTSITQDKFQGTAILKNVSTETSGRYQCESFNIKGTSTCIVRLEIITASGLALPPSHPAGEGEEEEEEEEKITKPEEEKEEKPSHPPYPEEKGTAITSSYEEEEAPTLPPSHPAGEGEEDEEKEKKTKPEGEGEEEEVEEEKITKPEEEKEEKPSQPPYPEEKGTAITSSYEEEEAPTLPPSHPAGEGEEEKEKEKKTKPEGEGEEEQEEEEKITKPEGEREEEEEEEEEITKPEEKGTAITSSYEEEEAPTLPPSHPAGEEEEEEEKITKPEGEEEEEEETKPEEETAELPSPYRPEETAELTPPHTPEETAELRSPYTPEETAELRSPYTPDLSGYMTPTPEGCCGPSGELFGDGDYWEKGCIVCTCNGNTGQMKCESYPCDEVVCGANEIKVFGDPSKQSGESCCGYCAPLTCKHNGVEYQINESFRDPDDPCLVYKCLETGLTAEAKKCLPQACAPDRRTYEPDGCCYKCDTKCKPTPAILNIEQPFTNEDRTKLYKMCKAQVSISSCNGQCERSTLYDDASKEVRVDCKCCKQEMNIPRSIQLDCSDGSKETHTIYDIATCACKSCDNLK